MTSLERLPAPRVAATRQRLLDAALATFARKGVHETRVEDICTAAGIARATFYRHFAGKAEVFLALHDDMGAELLRIAAALEPVTPDAAGLATLRQWVGEMLVMSEDWAPVIASLGASTSAGSALRAKSLSVSDRFSRQVGRRFAEGSVSGINTAMAALAVIALIDGVGHQMRTWSLDVDRDEMIELLTREALVMLHPGLDLRDLPPLTARI